MKIFSNLKLSRHGVYYYRAIVPASLITIIGHAEIKRSLYTKNPSLAKLYAQYLNLSLKIGLQGYQTLLSLNRSKLVGLKRMAKEFPDFDISSISTWKISRSDGLTLEADPNNPKDLASAEKLAALLFNSPGPTSSTPVNIKHETIKSNKAGWIERLRVEKINEKTIDEFQSKLDLFIEFINDIEIANISSKHVSNFVIKLSNGEITGKSITSNTVNKYLCAVNSFFKHAERNGLWPENKPFPTNKQRLKRTTKTRSSGYTPFDNNDLEKIFSAENICWKSLGGNDFRPHMLWLPILGLYTGARIEELCQLSIKNIYQDDDNVWIIDINDEDERQLKTQAAVRKIPLHPKLIELGFLNYINDIKANFPDEVLLFPYLSQNKYGKYGDSTSKWFGRYLEKLGITDSKKVFHSFRSTANNVLSKAGVHDEIRSQMVGHEYNTTNSTYYTELQTPKWLLDNIIPKLQYPNLDLKKLTYVNGAYIPITKKLLGSKLSKTKHSESKKRLLNS